MEILRVFVKLTGCETVEGHTQRAVILPFEGHCSSPLFTGNILPGGADTQRIEKDGRCSLSARYAMEGKDSTGKPCRLFIENLACSAANEEMVTHPSIRTDSEALKWLETAQMTGAIEHCGDHIEIVITLKDTPHVQLLELRRAGLTLRGRYEKKVQGPCPLVMMLHGFGGDMSVGEDSWFQQLSDSLTAAGCATLRFDFNGHGQSEGCFRDMTVYNEIEDAAAFLRYALDRGDVTHISLLGHSQGGVVAGMLAGYYHNVIRRLVMLAPAVSLRDDAQKGVCMQAAYDPQRIPSYVNVDGKHEVGGLYFRMAQTLPIEAVMGQYGGEAMVVACGKDVVVSGDAIRSCAGVMPRAKLLFRPTLDHGLGGEEQDALFESVVRFLTKEEEDGAIL